jgi:hypothetical protein
MSGPENRQGAKNLFFKKAWVQRVFWLGAPVGRFAKPVGDCATELFFIGPQRNIMICLALLASWRFSYGRFGKRVKGIK